MRRLYYLIATLYRLARKDSSTQYAVWEILSRHLFPGFFPTHAAATFRYGNFMAEHFGHSPEMASPFSIDRFWTLVQLTKLVRDLVGITGEAGVYRGASSLLLLRYLRRRHIAVDSWEGLSSPGEKDGTYWHLGDLRSALYECQKNLAQYNSFVEYHQGWIPGVFGGIKEEGYCFVHIDVDLYDPTFQSLAYFYPRMVRGGIILDDDYGFPTCPGAKQAVDEFFNDKPEQVICLPTGQAIVFKW